MQEFSYTAPLMGTELEVILINQTPCPEVFEALLNFGQSLEMQFSRFESGSDIFQLNQNRSLEMSLLMQQLLHLTKDLYKQTDGLFNPLLSPVHLGYNADFKTNGHEFENQKNNFNHNFSDLKFEGDTVTLAEGQILDFGGFLKGWVAERMTSFTTSVYGSLINLGGDIYVSGKDLTTDTFSLQIDNPVNPAKPVLVSLKDEALATSGTYKRKWHDKHHIVDARIEDSSQSDLVSASVISVDGAQADALATVCIVLGSQKAVELLDQLDLKYVLIHTDGNITQKLTA